MRTRIEDYTVGWICAIPTEYVVACELLDQEFDKGPEYNTTRDSNSYTFGQIHHHNVVIACLPKGRYGNTSSTLVGERMAQTFPNIQFGLIVGIAGGAPSQKDDIRLGDIVVSSPGLRHDGVLQYDYGKAVQEKEFEETGRLAPPPERLLTALAKIESIHQRKGHEITKTVNDMLANNKRLQKEYARPDIKWDRLYKATYIHNEEATCDCEDTDSQRTTDEVGDSIYEDRKQRNAHGQDPVIHYGLIASANQLMKNAVARNMLVKKHGMLCFEMEAAGLMNSFSCIVIRGICDYSDSHKNDIWQGYAAAAAAAYAKELLRIIPALKTESTQTMNRLNHQMRGDRFSIPFTLTGVPATKVFTNRPKEMQNLQDTLLSDDDRRKIFVLRGLGGIGKTQLAIEFMRRHQKEFTAIFWLDGSTEANLKQSLVSQARRISAHQISDESRINIESGTDAIVTQVLQWLAIAQNNRWLLIFDNVDREVDASDPFAYDVKQYFPDADHGSILITTRLAILEQLGHSREIKKMNKESAFKMLSNWYQDAKDDTHFQRLLELLDGLPLAIAQAGAYLQQTSMPIITYLRLFEEQQHDVSKVLHDPDFKLDDYPNRNLWTTWVISYEAILARNKHAAHLLLFWSFCDRSDLWYGMFEEAMQFSIQRDSDTVAKALTQWMGNIVKQESSFLEAIQLLRSYSLIEGSEESEGYTMHAVVHRWAHFYQRQQNTSDLGLLVFTMIGYAVPMIREPGSASLQRRILPHAQACSGHLFITMKNDTQAANSYTWDIRSNSCLTMEDILTASNNIGALYWSQGKLKEAEKMYMQALQGGEKAFGAKHMLTLETVNNLGMLYRNQGKLEKAEAMYMRALQGYEEALGEKHISTLKTINNLGRIYSDQGKLKEAENMCMRALRSSEEALGEKHISTLDTVNNLGILYRNQGKLEKAEAMCMRALQGYEEAHGEKHSSTLQAISNLGVLYGGQDKFKEAEDMYMRALQGQEEVFGEKHILTLETVNNLGVLYINQDKLKEAEEMLLRVRQGYTETFSSEQLRTYIPFLRNVWAFGDLYTKTRPGEAKSMYSKALDGHQMVLGPSSDICMEISEDLKALDMIQGSSIDPDPNPRSKRRSITEMQTREQKKGLQKLKQKILTRLRL